MGLNSRPLLGRGSMSPSGWSRGLIGCIIIDYADLPQSAATPAASCLKRASLLYSHYFLGFGRDVFYWYRLPTEPSQCYTSRIPSFSPPGLRECYLIMEYLHEANGFNETILQRQYEYFKDKPGRTLIGTRVKLMTLKPGAVTPDSNHEQGNWDPLNAPDDISTEKYLNYHLGEKLGSQPVGDSLQIWYGLLLSLLLSH
ncbi:hypothetical protein KCV07_g8217, partial [Aureobasidium melanogenum]